MTFYQKNSGVTLLEVLLVLAIAASLIWIGFEVYLGFKRDQDIAQIKYNVDMIFVAMKNFYQSNCGEGKALDPAKNPVNPSFPYHSISIKEDLYPNYLNKWPPIGTPIVDATGTDYGYVAQFNYTESLTRSYTACWIDYSTTPYRQNCSTEPIQTSSNYRPYTILWRSQVAVKIADLSKINTYKSMLLADCISSSSDGGITVDACTGTQTEKDYLVWEHLPSNQSPKMISPMWLQSPILKEFNLQYTHDVMYEVNNPDYASQQNYLCGS